MLEKGEKGALHRARNQRGTYGGGKVVGVREKGISSFLGEERSDTKKRKKGTGPAAEKSAAHAHSLRRKGLGKVRVEKKPSKSRFIQKMASTRACREKKKPVPMSWLMKQESASGRPQWKWEIFRIILSSPKRPDPGAPAR